MLVAIVGSGQLARLMALAGKKIGVRCSFLAGAEENASPVEGLGTLVRLREPWNPAQLLSALGNPDVVTVENEHVNLDLLRQLAESCPVHPNPDALAALGHRLSEKELIDSLGLDTAPFVGANNAQDIEVAAERLGLPLFIKACRGGYDGKGQWRLYSDEDVQAFNKDFPSGDWLAEARIDFEREVSLIAVRSHSGETAFYPLTENRHEEGILVSSIAPAGNVSPTLDDRARSYIGKLMDTLDYVGVMAMECFLAGDRLLINEIAPRVHNSGHWTLHSEATCQFENHLRAVLGLAPGATDIQRFEGIVNVLGQHWSEDDRASLPANADYVDYNKSAAPRRKLGHIHVSSNDREALRETLERLRPNLKPAA
ncbi:MAG: 5-(carboxyamino)imidazole ribonucleotide synthase [Pseudomonadota bacterium]